MKGRENVNAIAMSFLIQKRSDVEKHENKRVRAYDRSRSRYSHDHSIRENWSHDPFENDLVLSLGNYVPRTQIQTVHDTYQKNNCEGSKL